MDYGALRTMTLDMQFSVYGVPATVTPVNGDATDAMVIWLPPLQEDLAYSSQELQRREPRRILAVRTAEVPSLPRGSRIVAAEYGSSAARTWKVDGVVKAGETGGRERFDPLQLRVIVVPGE